MWGLVSLAPPVGAGCSCCSNSLQIGWPQLLGFQTKEEEAPELVVVAHQFTAPGAIKSTLSYPLSLNPLSKAATMMIGMGIPIPSNLSMELKSSSTSSWERRERKGIKRSSEMRGSVMIDLGRSLSLLRKSCYSLGKTFTSLQKRRKKDYAFQ